MAHLTRTFIKRWRKSRNISARGLALALGYRGRSYIKAIEGGRLPVTANFANRFVAFKRKTMTEEYKTRDIQSHYPLPRKIKILAKPQQCPICRDWFIFPYPQQRVCTATRCRAEARRRRA